MKNQTRFVLIIGAASLFTGCGGAQPPIGTPDTTPQSAGILHRLTSAPSYRVVWRFRGRHNGAYPNAGLTNVNGTLYGTTHSGGATGYGTVFSVTTTGAEKVLYSFKGGSDGANPYAGLVNRKGHAVRHDLPRWRRE